MNRHVLLAIVFVLASVARADEPAQRSVRMLFAQPNASAPAPIIRAGADRIADEYLVILKDDVHPEEIPAVALQFTTAFGATIEKSWSHAVKGFFARMTEAQAEMLRLSPLIKYVEENARWYLSPSHPTNINPATCDPIPPGSGNCTPVVDDRLWHLDRADQNYADPNNNYSYCTDGTGVTVYVVDSGVNKFHNEFAPGSRVQAGYNATSINPGVPSTSDMMPADDPCMRFAMAPSGTWPDLEKIFYTNELSANGHGTAVASAMGGRRVGIAKNVTIVPIKVIRCDYNSARSRVSARFYQQNETMWRAPTGSINNLTLYRAQNSGTTAGTEPTGWPTQPGLTFLDGSNPGGVTWVVVGVAEFRPPDEVATQMVVDGLNWILAPANPGPKSHAIVTMSTYRLGTDQGVAGSGNTVEEAIRNLLANNITVIASANNQNGNACDTSPSRLSINNPDGNIANSVITAGGSMLLNRPWTVDISDVPGTDVHEADGPKPGGFYGGGAGL